MSAAGIRWEDALAGGRLLLKLPLFLRHRLTPTAAGAILQHRLSNRETDFLVLARNAVYGNPRSPYLPLLRFAGCDYGDLEALVRKEGIEEALMILFRQGVYLTVEEYKGRRPIIRGSASWKADPVHLANPLARGHVPIQSSGSRGTRTSVPMDLGFIRGCAVDACVFLEAVGGNGWLKGDWEVPGGGAMFRLLKLSSFGTSPARWFSQIDPVAANLHARYRWSTDVMHWGSRLLASTPLPQPQYVSVDDPRPIVLWMEEVLAAGGIPLLYTFASSAVRVCRTAWDMGTALEGARFMLLGEPVTSAKLEILGRVGARGLCRYGTIECGPMGYACMSPEASDEVHLLQDRMVFIQAADQAAAVKVPPRALFVTTLRSNTPVILFNVSMGDQGTIATRSCGCPVEAAGWQGHLRDIRSYEKLTAAGMTFLDVDVVQILEEVLPRRFGGAPSDYQLVETEDGHGNPQLKLLVHPSLGPLNEPLVANVLLGAISAGTGAEHVMGALWGEAKLLTVERRPPFATASGKILHLHVNPSPEG